MGNVHVCGASRLPRAEYVFFDLRPVMLGSRSDRSRNAKVCIPQNSVGPNSPALNQVTCHKGLEPS